MELYQKVRHAVIIDGMSRRAASRYFGINRKTVDKMLAYPEPPQHGRSGRSFSGKLAECMEIIDKILADERTVHAKGSLFHPARCFKNLGSFMGQPDAVDMAGDQGGFVGGLQLQNPFAQIIRRGIELNGGGAEAAHADNFQKNPDRIPVRYASGWVCTLVRTPALR